MDHHFSLVIIFWSKTQNKGLQRKILLVWCKLNHWLFIIVYWVNYNGWVRLLCWTRNKQATFITCTLALKSQEKFYSFHKAKSVTFPALSAGNKKLLESHSCASWKPLSPSEKPERWENSDWGPLGSTEKVMYLLLAEAWELQSKVNWRIPGWGKPAYITMLALRCSLSQFIIC